MRPNSLKSFTLQVSYAENRIAKLPIVCSRAHQKVVPFLTILINGSARHLPIGILKSA